jgi:hypothetical protein
MDTKKSLKIPKKFFCETCDYTTSSNKDFNKHILTRKHNISQNGNQVETGKNPKTTQDFLCDCGKIYKNRSGLWKHQKICNEIHDSSKNNTSNNNAINSDIIIKLIADNSEIMMKLMKDNTELQTIIKDLVKNGITNNSHNTNSHNKSFNLQFFLNETCKDAMNLSDFVSSIVPTIEDLEATGRLGYAEGVSRIFIKKLNEVGADYRPVHCTDEKREVLYIKENNTWNKETEEKPILTKAIKQVAHKNIGKIIEWKNMYPDCTDSDSRKNDLYLNIVSNSMSGSSIEETNKNYSKIINKITKEVVVDKD